MADKQPAKTKRQVKNPETFRERAVKATEGSDKPTRASRLKSASGKASRPVLGPIGRGAATVFNFKPLRPVRKVLSILGKIIVPVYLRNSWAELRQVTWLTWRESRRLTYAVLIFAIVFGAIVSGVDFVLDKVFRHVLLK